PLLGSSADTTQFCIGLRVFVTRSLLGLHYKSPKGRVREGDRETNFSPVPPQVFWALISFGSGQKNHYLSLFIYLSICLPHGLSLVCSGGRSHLPPPICLPT
ncbi:hypothetical protein KUCAC02_018897, partial [Chaenocephalus aceratus]